MSFTVLDPPRFGKAQREAILEDFNGAVSTLIHTLFPSPGPARLSVRRSWRTSTELCPHLFTPCLPHQVRQGSA